MRQSDKISHLDMGDDRNDFVMSHIISPSLISISHIDFESYLVTLWCGPHCAWEIFS